MAANPPAKKAPPKNTMSDKMKPKIGCFPSGGTHALMSDLPLPKGDFMKAWKAKNSKYNLILLSGILAAVGTVTLCLGASDLNYSIPEYPYTDEELDEFAKEEERKKVEQEEREQRKKNLIDAKELKIRRRKAKNAMVREMELMQKDIDEGVNDHELAELLKLKQDREEFEIWEKDEVKRLEGKDKPKQKK